MHSSSTNFSTCGALVSYTVPQCARHGAGAGLGQRTMSSVFIARSLRNGRAITGTRCDADTWPVALLFRRYGTDMFNRINPCAER
jgi:hypothetical protein